MIYIGCSGWAYPSWKPEFYPPKTPTKKLLEAYADRLNSVEVNYTFRTLPSESTVSAWLAATPTTFRFSFKAPQRITHYQRLTNPSAPLAAFVQSIEPIIAAGRFGYVLFQLPPNLQADSTLLRGFLSEATATGLRLAFEFRHASWFDETTYDILREHGAALCVAESDELITPDVSTAPFSCYRLRRSAYSAKELVQERKRLRQRSKTGDVYAYFKHEEEPTGPVRASTVLEGLRQKARSE